MVKFSMEKEVSKSLDSKSIAPGPRVINSSLIAK